MENAAKNSNPAIQFAATHTGPAEHPILRLQRTAGNQAVLRWLRPRDGETNAELEGNGEPDKSDGETQPQSEPTSKPIWPGVIPAIMIVTFLAYFCYRIAMH